MKILFDHQIYTNQNYGGISRYFYELTKGLSDLGNECETSVYFSENEYTKDKRVFNSRPFFPFYFKGRGKLKEHFNRIVSQRSLKKGGFDVFHPTYYDPYFLKSKPARSPFVVTFHDLIHEKFSGRYPTLLTNIDEVLASRIAMLSNASQIIAVSESTKRDIIEHYGVPPDRIHVIHLASSLFVENILISPPLIETPYILFVGTRIGYKNFNVFLEAVAELVRRESDLTLVCAGGGKFSEAELLMIKKLGISNKVRHVPIDDQRLALLYKNALFFVFPSLYEGFGIPALEAFNCGCPAILSGVSSLPEVGGDAALYLDPENPADILEKCEMLYGDAALREHYRTKGLERAGRFSWCKVAGETLRIYQSAL